MTDADVINRLLAIIEADGEAIARSVGWRGEEHGACVAMTKVGCGVLARFGIPAKPFPVSIIVRNIISAEWVRAGCPGISAPPGAWGRGSKLTVTPDAELTAGEFGGHLVVWLPRRHTVLDLDLRHWADPEHGVVLPMAMELDWPNASEPRAWDLSNGCRIEMEARPTLTQYSESELWTINPVQPINDLVRRIREGR